MSAEQPLVTLEVYSGQANPTWPLEGEALREMTARLRDAQRERVSASAPSPLLGYRGFRIERLAEPDLPEAVFVGRGTVAFVSGTRAEYRQDTLDLEAVLLDDARRRGFGELLEAAGAPSPPRTAG